MFGDIKKVKEMSDSGFYLGVVPSVEMIGCYDGQFAIKKLKNKSTIFAFSFILPQNSKSERHLTQVQSSEQMFIEDRNPLHEINDYVANIQREHMIADSSFTVPVNREISTD
jgi:hypothetical protein